MISAYRDGPAAGIAADRRVLFPSPTLPIAYFAAAHLCLALALAALAAEPGLSTTFYSDPKVLALVHLVTLGFISGSILGALYIVVPLAFGVSMRATRPDGAACFAFWLGVAGMVGGFWHGRFDCVGASSALVLGAVAWIGVRVVRAVSVSRVPVEVSCHVVLAFCNLALAGTGGLLLALGHLGGPLAWSPLALAAAHAHLAVLGWATMMIVGVAYRLIPMFVPAEMPRGRGLAVSAVCLEIGALGVATTLAVGRSPVPWLAFVIAGLYAFLSRVRWIVRHRRPRPVDLPPRDWSTWQTHAAIAFLVLAAGLGLRLATVGGDPAIVWAYGVAGLVGFVAQMVLGISGRLMPMHAWYRACERGDGALPGRSVHRLIVPSMARAVLLCWVTGVPLLLLGILAAHAAAVAVAATTLLAGVVANGAHLAVICRRATTG